MGREDGRGDGLEAMRRALASWRAESGGPGRRIPEALWAAAAKVARVNGVRETARALRLDEARLGMLAGAKAEIVNPASDAGFVEVVGLGPSASGTGTVAIELVGRDGDRVRVEMRDGGVNVVELARAFWSRA